MTTAYWGYRACLVRHAGVTPHMCRVQSPRSSQETGVPGSVSPIRYILGAGLHARQADAGVTSDAMSGPYGTATGALLHTSVEDTTETARRRESPNMVARSRSAQSRSMHHGERQRRSKPSLRVHATWVSLRFAESQTAGEPDVQHGPTFARRRGRHGTCPATSIAIHRQRNHQPAMN